VAYALHLFTFVLIYGMLALSLTVSSGFTHRVSLAQASFFGVGAYATAILTKTYGWPAEITIPLGMLIAGGVALLLAFVSLRTVEEYFLICTLGVGIIIHSTMNNAAELTRGPLGIANIPPATLFGIQFNKPSEVLMLAGGSYSLMFWLVKNLKSSALGRLLVALGEDEIFCQSLGKDVKRAKVQSFVIGAMFAAVPGAIYAHYVSFVDPSSFTVHESIFVLTIIIVGGLGRLWGSLVATTFMLLLPEVVRFLGIPFEIAAHLRQMLFGIAMILVVTYYRKPGSTDAIRASPVEPSAVR
jgi:branched-chain amino acid transport system permease protein